MYFGLITAKPFPFFVCAQVHTLLVIMVFEVCEVKSEHTCWTAERLQHLRPLLNFAKLLREPTLVTGEPMEGIEEEKHTVVKWNTNTECKQTQASTPKKTKHALDGVLVA